MNSSSLVVLGGLDDRVANLPNFSNRALLLTSVPETQYDNHYDLKMLATMYSKRGCASAVFHQGFVYAMGGINYTEKVLKRCERLNLKTGVWQPITSMKECRKNASACAMTSDTIYVFGGTSNT